MLTEFHIGIDDTDSRSGGCTTYTASLLFQELCDRGFRPVDFPWLVRLNPNIPWKTRGNGALSIHLMVNDDKVDEVKSIALRIVESTIDGSARGADPAVTFLRGPTPLILHEYFLRSLHEVLTVGEARNTARIINADIHSIKGVRGIIGSLASLGARLDVNDHSYEIIAYRSKENLGKLRDVDQDTVREMDFEYGDRTFQNLDPETGRTLVCPHGPDPVLLGIRGKSPDVLLEAFRRIRVREPVERIMIFRTNQGTDAHIKLAKTISSLRPFCSAVVSSQVKTIPTILRGGHVVFQVADDTGSINCVAFRPSGSMMRIARELLPGDGVRVSGGVRRRGRGLLSLNLEKIEITQLTDAFRDENPGCPICGGHCESMGRDQGLRCKKCRFRWRNLARNRTTLERNLSTVVSIPPPRARRHLTKPDTPQDSGHPPRVPDGYSYESLLRAIWTQMGNPA